MKYLRITQNKRLGISGLSLVEALVGAAVFLIIALAVYQSYELIFKLVGLSRTKTAAFELAQERVETIRNMPYADIGIVAGIPSGLIPRVATYTRSGLTFQATTTVRNVDDPFDGVLGGTANDLSPADYKLVEMEIGCVTCKDFSPIYITAQVSPRSLETTTGNGALFVQVIDANGQPVPGADIVIDGQSTSTVLINETSNNLGLFQLVDVPPGNFLYAISVDKAGYSSDRTYVPGDVLNPNPLLPHATVAQGSVTQITFSIDKLSSVNVRTVTETCAPVASVPITISGQKKIGTGPDVLKYERSIITDANGEFLLSDLEWDTYNVELFWGGVISGTMPFLPFSLSPNTAQELIIVPKSVNPETLLVRVKDRSSGLPVAGANVTLTGYNYSSTLYTSRGFLHQTDWSGGGGEEYYTTGNKFNTFDWGIEYASSTGEITLTRIFNDYVTSGSMVSPWFDVGVASTTLYSLDWLPVSQNILTGPNSVKFQLESSDDVNLGTTGFLGPDGTNSTYYTVPGSIISSDHTNKRFIRYKVFLSTADVSVTPLVSDVSLTFGTNCTPFGQVFYSNLTPGSFTIDVSAPGYLNYSGPVTVSSGNNIIDIDLDI